MQFKINRFCVGVGTHDNPKIKIFMKIYQCNLNKIESVGYDLRGIPKNRNVYVF